MQHQYYALDLHDYHPVTSRSKLIRNYVNFISYIRSVLLLVENLTNNKEFNTSRNNVLDSRGAKSFLHSLVSLVSHPEGCVATHLTRQTH